MTAVPIPVEDDFKGTWGVSRATFEGLTLGTLGVLLLVAVVGYMTGSRVRAHQVSIPIEEIAEPAY